MTHNMVTLHSKAELAHTKSTRHESARSLPPLYPIQEKNRISCMETAHTGSMQHTRTWKKTYTGNDRQFQYLTRKLRAKIEM